MTLAILVFNFYPVTAIMIIILALLNDIPIMAIAYDNTKVEPQPVRWCMREVLIPALSTRVVGTRIAVYGLFMEPVGWKYALYIYIYATAWCVFNDFLKVAICSRLHKTKRLLGREHVLEALE